MRSRELQSFPRESKISFYGEFELLDKNLLEREQIELRARKPFSAHGEPKTPAISVPVS